MTSYIQHVVIVGGGTAGWLTAAMLAADHQHRIKQGSLSVTLVESKNISPIGVGEGTWPTMPQTLKRIGLSEHLFFSRCFASFKQGSKFLNWHSDSKNHVYYHPFEVPNGSAQGLLAEGWLATQQPPPYAECFSTQPSLAREHKAPKTLNAGEFESHLNYGYHLDATEFSKLLCEHATQRLGVKHHIADISTVEQDENGITGVVTKQNQTLRGDLFVDCTGFHNLLLGKSFGVKNISVKDVLFADKAIAIQVPHAHSNTPIYSFTHATAQEAGWIWDIGLTSRRGIGYVYSSNHQSECDAKRCLTEYLNSQAAALNLANIDESHYRTISFESGYKEKFWHKNCVAIGLSAGFIEPLEASALVMTELAASFLSEQLPRAEHDIVITSQRFNEVFTYRWERVVEFLKLHYVLSERTGKFWQDNKAADTVPERLQQLLTLWQSRVPMQQDFDRLGEIFGVASYQYVLYGSGFKTQMPFGFQKQINEWVGGQFRFVQQQKQNLVTTLPTNRELLEQIKNNHLKTGACLI